MELFRIVGWSVLVALSVEANGGQRAAAVLGKAAIIAWVVAALARL